MGDKSSIEWTDATWNPIRGCSRVSEGCRNCYAERAAVRQIGTGYRGLVNFTKGGPRWTGEVRFVEEALTLPLRWRSPRRIFVNSMSDLFHEKVASEWVDRIFAVMAQTPRHTYQILTKRAETMLSYCGAMAAISPKARSRRIVESMYRGHPAERVVLGGLSDERTGDFPWPLPNVWLGVSVEDQAAADERIPLLLQTPAAVRWVSYEPALGPVRFHQYLGLGDFGHVDWIVVGGESGPGARPFDLAWARRTVEMCRAAGTPCFVKQLGAHPHTHHDGRAVCLHPAAHHRCNGFDWHRSMLLRDRKGGDMAEWPEDLRVRESPAMEREAK